MSTATPIRIEEYFPLVQRIVIGIRRRLPAYVERDDLEQTGMVGLLEAAGRYNPRAGVEFKKYASSRIRGAILDALRGEDNCSRELRRLGKFIKEIESALRVQLGREPESDEVAFGAEISLSELHETRFLLEAKKPADLMAASEQGDSEDPLNKLPAPQPPEIEDHVNLERWMSGLNPKLKKVIKLRYAEQLGFEEIGQRIGLSQGRAHQLHTEAIVQMRLKATGHWN